MNAYIHTHMYITADAPHHTFGAAQLKHRTSLFVEGFLPGPLIAQEGTGSPRVWKSMSPTSLGEHRSSVLRPLSRRTSCFSSSMRRFRGGCTRRHASSGRYGHAWPVSGTHWQSRGSSGCMYVLMAAADGRKPGTLEPLDGLFPVDPITQAL